jgi:hypothetical protein
MIDICIPAAFFGMALLIAIQLVVKIMNYMDE